MQLSELASFVRDLIGDDLANFSAGANEKISEVFKMEKEVMDVLNDLKSKEGVNSDKVQQF